MITTDNGATTPSKKVYSSAAGSAGLVLVLNNAANTIINQAMFPKLDVKGLENINDHLAKAKTHANSWINKYSSEVLGTLQGVITFGELYNNLFSSLYDAAQHLGTEKSFQLNEISSLISQIQALQVQVQQEATTLTTTYADITEYKTNAGADYSQFQTDYNTAQAELGGDEGDKGALKRLQDKIDAENSALTKDTYMIAFGPLGIVAGTLCIVAGVFGEIETAGATTALIIVGVALLAGGATVTGIGGKNMDDTLKQLKQDYINLQNMRIEIALLTSASGQLKTLNQNLEETEKALQSLITSWQELNNSFAAVVNNLQNPENYLQNLQKNDPSATPETVSVIVSAELKTANDDWQSAVKQAQTMLDNCRNPVYLTSGKLPTQEEILSAYQAKLKAA